MFNPKSGQEIKFGFLCFLQDILYCNVHYPAPFGGTPSPCEGDFVNRPLILDLGTGTGCLLLALLSALPNATGVGVDQNPRALEQATKNAQTLGLAGRAQFLQSNWLDHVEGKFDLIISNPPYIATQELETLAREVRDFDPLPALDGGDDGLCAYRAIIPKLKDHMTENASILFEVGVGQAESVKTLLEKVGFINVLFYKDLSGIERVVGARMI